MAPVNKMRTYSRSNNSIVNNSVDAFNVLFAKNMTKRLIGKKKNKYMIKQLPPRTKSETVLIDESLHISTDDTFDKLLKGNMNKLKDMSSSSKPDNSERLDKKVSITETSSFYSPIMTRRRMKIPKINDSTGVCDLPSSTKSENNSNDPSNPYQSRLNQTTVCRIDESIEIEKIRKKEASSSYIVLTTAPRISIEPNNIASFNNIFTKTFYEKQPIHSSTPLATKKSQKNLVNNTISPIRNLSSLVKESFDEIKKWDQKFPEMDGSKQGHARKSSDFLGFSKEEQIQSSIFENYHKRGENSEIYMSLRKRKISKSNCRKNSRQQNSLTVSLEKFSCFESQNSIKENKYSDFVTKRRKIFSDSQLVSITEKIVKSYPSSSGENLEKLSTNISSDNELNSHNSFLEDLKRKELVVNITRVPDLNVTTSEIERSLMKSCLSSSEEFYLEPTNQLTSDCDNVNNTAENTQDINNLVVNLIRNRFDLQNEDSSQVQCKDLLVNLTRNVELFENFYTKNYNSSDSSSVISLDTFSKTEDESVIETSCIESPDKMTKSALNKQGNDLTTSPKPTFEVVDLTSPRTEKNPNETKNIDQSRMNDSSNFDQSYLQQKSESHLSDIIESSIQESSQNVFKIPNAQTRKRPSKILLLKAGKSWRRSLSMFRRSSILVGIIEEEKCLLSIGKNCECAKCTVLGDHHNKSVSRRLSVKIVPKHHLHLTKRRTETSLLEDYAFNASYVSDQILESNLENSLRCLSLSGTRNSNLSQNPLPVTAREIVLRRCGQTEPLPFLQCYPNNVLQNCQKIGEGVYGEVFLFKNPKGGTSVIKIIPIEGSLIVNGERQKKFEEILSEVIIATELSNLRNNKKNATSTFSEVQEIHCVQGRYPEKLLDLWELYEETQGTENDCPEIFREDQLYMVLQLANGGRDLESYVFNNAHQAYVMFKQVAFALAVSENELNFEHRDLHWGNILLSTVEKNKSVSFTLDGEIYNIPTKGVEATIIDFTLSRIEYDGVVIFNDLALDPELFTAEGDYQFEIYKLMQKKNRNNWLEFEPFSNLLWLHYTLDKAITALRYKNAQSKTHKENLMKLKQLYEEVLNFKSVKDFVLNCLV